MAVQFFFEDRFKNTVTVSPVVPAFCKPHLIDRANTVFTSGEFGSFLSQEILGEDYTICEYRFYINDKGLLYPVTTTPLLTLLYVLKGSLKCLLQGFGPVELTEGNYYFFYIPANVCHEAYFETGEYIFFHINLDPNYLFRLSTRSPSVKELIRRQKENIPAGIRESTGLITLKEKTIIEQIRSSIEEIDQRDIFFRARIYDLLLLYSKDLQKMTDAAQPHNNRYMNKISEVKNYIDSKTGKPFKIGDLSKKFNINSQALKIEFKAAYGKSIYAYQLQSRMDKACQMLLQQNVSIDKIAGEIGYDNTSSFIVKFRELFGLTPYQYHKKYVD